MSAHPPEFESALGLFNQAKFFEAHEALEDLWRGVANSSPAKRHLQGLVQLAVAFHHESLGNLHGARSVLDRARRNLVGAEVSFPQIKLDSLHRELAAWQEYLADGGVRPAPLRITLRDVR